MGLPPVDGPPIDRILNLAAGETQSLYLDADTDCTISETPPTGCTLVSISPSTVIPVTELVVSPVTVTNNCEVAAAPAAVSAAPTFTG